MLFKRTEYPGSFSSKNSVAGTPASSTGVLRSARVQRQFIIAGKRNLDEKSTDTMKTQIIDFSLTERLLLTSNTALTSP